MRLFLMCCLCLLVMPLGAVPSLTDLDSWQIPDEPEPVQQQAPKPAPKPVVDAGPEIVIEMASDSTVQGPSRQQTSQEISILNRPAKQLAKNLAGKSRFYVLFNATTKATSDTMVEALDGTRYALLLYGQEGGNYRQLLFKYWQDQPLVAVAEKVQDKLDIFRDYGVNLGLTETDFTTTYPNVQAKEIEDAKDHTLYRAYKFSDNFLVVFKEGTPSSLFQSEEALTAYINQLQYVEPDPETVEKPQKRSIYAPIIPVAPRLKFSEIVKQGTIAERMYREQHPNLYNDWDEQNSSNASSSRNWATNSGSNNFRRNSPRSIPNKRR